MPVKIVLPNDRGINVRCDHPDCPRWDTRSLEKLQKLGWKFTEADIERGKVYCPLHAKEH